MKSFVSLIALVLSIFVCSTLLPADAARVYVMSSGDSDLDNQVATILTGHGHTVTIGVPYHQFNGTQDLSGIDVVYLQANWNWTSGDMPLAGQTALLQWLTDPNHGLVTGEWVVWKNAAGSFQTLGDAFAVPQDGRFRSSLSATFSRATISATLNAGLPNNFTFNVTSYGGTETFLLPKPGARVFYRSDFQIGEVRGRGLVGGYYLGSRGRVLHFSTTNGPDQLAHVHFARLLSNAMNWAASDGLVLGDVNDDGCVDDADLLAVLFSFGGGDPDADLDNNLTVDDADLLLVLFNFGNGC